MGKSTRHPPPRPVPAAGKLCSWLCALTMLAMHMDELSASTTTIIGQRRLEKNRGSKRPTSTGAPTIHESVARVTPCSFRRFAPRTSDLDFAQLQQTSRLQRQMLHLRRLGSILNIVAGYPMPTVAHGRRSTAGLRRVIQGNPVRTPRTVQVKLSRFFAPMMSATFTAVLAVVRQDVSWSFAIDPDWEPIQ